MSGCKGLSLVEMMVVLVIVAIVTGLLVEGLGNAMLLFERVNTRQIDRFGEAIEIAWWRESVEAAAPNRWRRSDFRGTDRSLQLETYQPLIGPAGIPTPVIWTIEGGRLRYRERLASGQLSESIGIDIGPGAAFRFMDREGVWFDRWPRHDGDEEIPSRVLVEAGDLSIESYIYGHPDAVVYIDEIEYGDVE